MPINLRSLGQRERHAASRRAIDDRRRLEELLVRHEVELEKMVGEIRTALSELGTTDGWMRRVDQKYGKNGYDEAGAPPPEDENSTLVVVSDPKGMEPTVKVVDKDSPEAKKTQDDG